MLLPLVITIPFLVKLASVPTMGVTGLLEPIVATTNLVTKVIESQVTPKQGPFNYEYVEAELAIGDLDGLRLRGSYPLQESVFLTGGVSSLSGDDGPIDFDIFSLSVGATYVHTFADDLDFFGSAELDFARAEASLLGISASESEFGLLLRAGTRYAFDEQIEFFGSGTIRTAFDSPFTVDAGARYQISEELAVQARLEFGDDTTFNLGLRYSF